MPLPPGPESRALRAASVVAAVEGVVLLAYGAFVTVQGIRVGPTGPADVSNLPEIVTLAALFLVFGAALLWVGHGLWRARRWARAPMLLAQVLGLVVGIPLAQAAEAVPRLAGIALTALSVVGLVVSFGPGVTDELEGRDGDGPV